MNYSNGPNGLTLRVNLIIQVVGSDFLPDSSHIEPVAQLVEHRTFNAVVAGSSPARLTKSLI
jgi:hypothetical protein